MIQASDMPELEMWGGAECTVARVGDRWGDQSHLSGHHDRDCDLQRFADLGFQAMRYPVLWERISPERPDLCDWTWTDRRLGALRDLGIRPIAGLLHHGSGPHHTSLLDPDFAAKLGDYAGRVAERYPWIADYTPVNEPLTTARFSALYGHWYPHHRDEGSFWTALVNQVDGVAHAMRAIRAVTPGARLIQTDDLGRTYATAPLFHQAGFDNLRRWAGWDLLFGRVVPGHPLWDRIAGFGLGARLDALATEPCPPDVIGVNHYLTSDRFLDHRLQRYPAHTHGANFEQRYADVEAVRVLEPAPGGLAGALREAWERYRTPLAVTEVHLGCTREEQLRWVGEAWDTARALRTEGVDLRAVTSWAVLGSCGWNTLLTSDGLYEPGLFDVSGAAPRPTALADAWRGLPDDAERHPVARAPGWWRRPTRLLYPPVRRPARFERSAPVLPSIAAAPPLLIYGAGGTLGQALARHCDARAIGHVVIERSATPGGEFGAALDRHRPWAVIDATGWTEPEKFEDRTATRRGLVVHDAAALARAADERGIPTLRFSSDLVFGATADRPRLENDPTMPDDAIGHALDAVERIVRALPGRHLIVRTGEPFDPGMDTGLAADIARALGAGRPFVAAGDDQVTPGFVPRIVDAALDLLIDGADGVWHLTHGEPLSTAALARAVARACGLDPALVEVVAGDAGQRPRAALGTAKGLTLGAIEDALGHFAWGRTRRIEAGERRAA
jgi:dTDP-4-dehydrorhamnose reductase